MYNITRNKNNFIFKTICAFINIAFLTSTIMPINPAQAQSIGILPSMPAPGTMVMPSQAFAPALLKGLTVYPDSPFEFDFIVDSGEGTLTKNELSEETKKMVRYFLASLTIPKDDLWVNLSPEEKDRIVPKALGETELGRDMLAQDYLLKQFTASLMYPENELGEKFWNEVCKKAQEKYGTVAIPADTFSKVWIMPDKAVIYENNNTVFVAESRLKVMTDVDYEAMSNQRGKEVANPLPLTTPRSGRPEAIPQPSADTSQIIKEIIIPAIEKEVNEGEHFAPLRQIYNALILAKWYKETVKKSLLDDVYINKRKISGIDLKDKNTVEEIYQKYIEAFKKGVYNYIKEEYNPETQEIIPRKYFSGGINNKNIHLQNNGLPTSDPIESFDGPGFNSHVQIVSSSATKSTENREQEPLSSKPYALSQNDEAMLVDISSEKIIEYIESLKEKNKEKYELAYRLLAVMTQFYPSDIWLQREMFTEEDGSIREMEESFKDDVEEAIMFGDFYAFDFERAHNVIADTRDKQLYEEVLNDLDILSIMYPVKVQDVSRGFMKSFLGKVFGVLRASGEYVKLTKINGDGESFAIEKPSGTTSNVILHASFDPTENIVTVFLSDLNYAQYVFPNIPADMHYSVLMVPRKNSEDAVEISLGVNAAAAEQVPVGDPKEHLTKKTSRYKSLLENAQMFEEQKRLLFVLCCMMKGVPVEEVIKYLEKSQNVPEPHLGLVQFFENEMMSGKIMISPLDIKFEGGNKIDEAARTLLDALRKRFKEDLIEQYFEQRLGQLPNHDEFFRDVSIYDTFSTPVGKHSISHFISARYNVEADRLESFRRKQQRILLRYTELYGPKDKGKHGVKQYVNIRGVINAEKGFKITEDKLEIAIDTDEGVKEVVVLLKDRIGGKNISVLNVDAKVISEEEEEFASKLAGQVKLKVTSEDLKADEAMTGDSDEAMTAGTDKQVLVQLPGMFEKHGANLQKIAKDLGAQATRIAILIDSDPDMENIFSEKWLSEATLLAERASKAILSRDDLFEDEKLRLSEKSAALIKKIIEKTEDWGAFLKFREFEKIKLLVLALEGCSANYAQSDMGYKNTGKFHALNALLKKMILENKYWSAGTNINNGNDRIPIDEELASFFTEKKIKIPAVKQKLIGNPAGLEKELVENAGLLMRIASKREYRLQAVTALIEADDTLREEFEHQFNISYQKLKERFVKNILELSFIDPNAKSSIEKTILLWLNSLKNLRATGTISDKYSFLRDMVVLVLVSEGKSIIEISNALGHIRNSDTEGSRTIQASVSYIRELMRFEDSITRNGKGQHVQERIDRVMNMLPVKIRRYLANKFYGRTNKALNVPASDAEENILSFLVPGESDDEAMSASANTIIHALRRDFNITINISNVAIVRKALADANIVAIQTANLLTDFRQYLESRNKHGEKSQLLQKMPKGKRNLFDLLYSLMPDEVNYNDEAMTADVQQSADLKYIKGFLDSFVPALSDLGEGSEGKSLKEAFPDDKQRMDYVTDVFLKLREKDQPNFWMQPHLLLDEESAILIFKNGPNGIKYGSNPIAYKIDFNKTLPDISSPDVLEELLTDRSEYFERFERELRVYLAYRAIDHSPIIDFQAFIFTWSADALSLIRSSGFELRGEFKALYKEILGLTSPLSDSLFEIMSLAKERSRKQKIMRSDETREWQKALEYSVSGMDKIYPKFKEAELMLEKAAESGQVKMTWKLKKTIEEFTRAFQAFYDSIMSLNAFAYKSDPKMKSSGDIASVIRMAAYEAGSTRLFVGNKEIIVKADANGTIDLKAAGFPMFWDDGSSFWHSFLQGKGGEGNSFILKIPSYEILEHSAKGNYRMLGFALDNLIKGAQNVSGENQEIVFEVKEDEDNFYFSVSDNGPGINPETLWRISDPDFTTKAGETGHAVTKRILEDVGGQMEFDTLTKEQATPDEIARRRNVGKRTEIGTTVTITWPKAEADEAMSASANTIIHALRRDFNITINISNVAIVRKALADANIVAIQTANLLTDFRQYLESRNKHGEKSQLLQKMPKGKRNLFDLLYSLMPDEVDYNDEAMTASQEHKSTSAKVTRNASLSAIRYPLTARNNKYTARIGNNERTIYIESAKTGNHVRTINLPSVNLNPVDLKFVPGRNYISVITDNNFILVFDIDTGKQISRINDYAHEATPVSFAYSPNGENVAVLYDNGFVHVYDIYLKKRTKTLQTAFGSSKYKDIAYKAGKNNEISVLSAKDAGGDRLDTYNLDTGQRIAYKSLLTEQHDIKALLTEKPKFVKPTKTNPRVQKIAEEPEAENVLTETTAQIALDEKTYSQTIEGAFKNSLWISAGSHWYKVSVIKDQAVVEFYYNKASAPSYTSTVKAGFDKDISVGSYRDGSNQLAIAGDRMLAGNHFKVNVHKIDDDNTSAGIYGFELSDLRPIPQKNTTDKAMSSDSAGTIEASSPAVKVYEYRLSKGARVLSMREIPSKIINSQDKPGSLLKAEKTSGEVQTEYDYWEEDRHSLSEIENKIHFKEHLIKMARSNPEKTFRVVDGGCGAGTALIELYRELKKEGIENVELIGYSKDYYADWHQAPEGITFIFGVDDEIIDIFKKSFTGKTIDFIFSYFGIFFHAKYDPADILDKLTEILSEGAQIHLGIQLKKDRVLLKRTRQLLIAFQKAVPLMGYSMVYPSVVHPDLATSKDRYYLSYEGKDQAKAADVGGIDMNNIELERYQASKIELHFDPVEINNMLENGVDGFVPIIINMVPINSVLPLLGMKEPDKGPTVIDHRQAEKQKSWAREEELAAL